MPAIRFSLKWLMTAIAMAAFAIAALANASQTWAILTLTVFSLLALAALLAAAFSPAASRTFARGYLVGFFFYLLLWQAAKDNWFELHDSYLLTNRAVDRLFLLVAGKPPEEVAAQGGVSFWTGKPLSIGPAPIPNYFDFRRIAHWLFACGLGLVCGLIAKRLRSQNPRQ